MPCTPTTDRVGRRCVAQVMANNQATVIGRVKMRPPSERTGWGKRSHLSYLSLMPETLFSYCLTIGCREFLIEITRDGVIHWDDYQQRRRMRNPDERHLELEAFGSLNVVVFGKMLTAHGETEHGDMQ